jgi:hypothetical protein
VPFKGVAVAAAADAAAYKALAIASPPGASTATRDVRRGSGGGSTLLLVPSKSSDAKLAPPEAEWSEKPIVTPKLPELLYRGLELLCLLL